ncbi:MAG: DUF4197 domain-containing protein [Pseudomonadota bacterium]|nr:DUF4197 domain-containing protein [Pseudomonadota bacterium]
MSLSRRHFILALAGLACVPSARAEGWSSVTAAEATQALRDSLSQGARAAIARLGRENGYFGYAKAKIGLPKNFARAEGILRFLGLGKQVDDLVLAMNRAAEAAVPEARDVVLEAVRKISVVDAKAILAGGDGAATAWFRKETEAHLVDKMAPIIHAVAERSDLVRAYNALSSQLVKLADIKSELATVENYVNRKTLDGLYTLIAEEEHSIRAQPLNYAGGVVGKVFGLLN